MQDHYQTLGVNRTSSQEEIKRAYRKLASAHHPDKGGDKSKFQSVQQAYDTLSDPQKKNQYDNPMSQFQNTGAGFDFDSIFSMFGQNFQQQQHHPRRPQNVRMTLWITLKDAAQGGFRAVSIGTQNGVSAVDIEIPLAINDGDAVQYPGIGPSGLDLIVTYRIHPQPQFQRNGLTLHSEHTVDIWDLIIGCQTQVRDVLGNNLAVTVPPRTQPGTVLRLKGRGLRDKGNRTGDLLVKIQTRLPEHIDPEIINVINEKYKQN
jgi:curved DNA-binding protein